MTSRIYEIPKRLADLLKTVGPIHEESAGNYCYAIRLVLRDDDAPAGFVVEQRLAERSVPTAKGKGFVTEVPVKADMRSEGTFVFVETLAAALDYGRRENPEGHEDSRAT